MPDNTVSLHLSDDTKRRLERLSQATDRSPTALTTEALEVYLAQQEWQIAAVDDAVRLADQGEFVSQDAMVAWLTSWGKPTETAAPKPPRTKTAQ